MAEEQEHILIVEDDLDSADMLSAYLNIQKYQVRVANWGEDAIRACQETLFDLIILDIRLPDIDGFEVARRLRQNRRTAKIPIIFLTERRNRADRLQGLEIGADDYLTKPYDVQELRLRVRNALQRAALGVVINPVTNLPEGEAFFNKVSLYLGQSEWAALAVELENLDYFRELYGFIASDDVIKAVGVMLNNSVRDEGSLNDFIGMLSSTQFLILTQPVHLNSLIGRVKTRLAQGLEMFYPIKDRDRSDLPNRLSIQLVSFTSEDGTIRDLDALKKRLAV